MKSLIEEASTITKAVEKAWVRAGKPAEFTIKVFEEPKYNFIGMTTKSAKVAIFFKSHEAATSVPLHEKKDAKTYHKEQNHTKNRHPRPQQDQSHSRASHNKNYAPTHSDRSEQRQTSHRAHPDERVSRDHTKPLEGLREPRQQATLRENKDRFEHRDPQEHSMQRESRSKPQRERRPYRDKQERPDAIWSNEMADIAQDWLENMLTLLGKKDQLTQAKIVGPNLKFEFKESLTQDREKEKLLFASWAHLILATVGNKYKKDLRGLKIVLSNNSE